MKMLDAVRLLRQSEMDFIDTADAAALLKTGTPHASKIMSRLAEAGQLFRVKRGVWAFADRIDPLQMPGAITAPLPSYISLQTALYRHGIISQMPHVVYAVSPARTQRRDTSSGMVSIHHIDPAFFFGYEQVGAKGLLLAEPEKALLDLLYLSPARSGLFRHPPELEFSETFSFKKADEMAERITSQRRRTLVRQHMREIQLQYC